MGNQKLGARMTKVIAIDSEDNFELVDKKLLVL